MIFYLFYVKNLIQLQHILHSKNPVTIFKEVKEELSQNEVIVLEDFAENHNFLV